MSSLLPGKRKCGTQDSEESFVMTAAGRAPCDTVDNGRGDDEGTGAGIAFDTVLREKSPSGSYSRKKAKRATEPLAEGQKETATEDILQESEASSCDLIDVNNLSDYEKCSIFPQKLHQLLKSGDAPGAIWWLEDGESFAIEPEKFTKVMNKLSRTAKKHVKLDSILRNLYRWGFKKLKDKGLPSDLPSRVLAYSHPNFKRDAPGHLHSFSQRPVSASGETRSVATAGPSTTPLARALCARAQAGYGEDWNVQGAATSNRPASRIVTMPPQQYSPYFGERAQQMQLQLLQQQQQQRQQMLLQQNLLLPQGRPINEQALFLGASSAAGRAASQRYVVQRFGSSLYNNQYSGRPTYPY